ncbi:hypothetical protein ONE63_003933 [Megalurothrips usitatus]|uniref:FHA domain-containing protein n=1 Tax=Megalurothrips usitatus TaxID=439358 RepID=A0AAV7XBJ0_9NEOP|nr:hypothetical protein ONE63_003933 [Megalurothrips usitatus]
MEGKEEATDRADVEMTDAAQDAKPDNFKKPQLCLVGPRKSKGAKIRVVDVPSEVKAKEENLAVPGTPEEMVAPIEPPEVAPEPEETLPKPMPEPERKPSKPRQGVPAQKLKETPIPYLEPKWGGVPPESYSLDVIKSGTVLDPIDLSAKSYIVFGRQTNCDVQMAHPTVSRHHAVLQYSKGSEEKQEGFYLYDLGSTHGTFLNKNRVRPEMFIRIRVGHQIKLGGSTRLYLLQGPPEDMEAESELTVTELKAKRQSELQARELAEAAQKQKEEEEKKKREEEGIDWGMGDDADEETDLSENPYAITTNEELYIDDPKKTLRGWFEREGHELEYDVEEKGPGQFLCRVDVPVEGARGGNMVAEVLIKGKKKEAVAQCALEACRLLDRLGLLRQATHESRKRKAKNWEEEDFYDSDEDNFLDRTGAVEKKRQQRMRQAGKADQQVETYQSLSEKHSDILKKLGSTEAQLRKAQADLAASKAKHGGDEEADSLESFMNTLSSVGCVDKKLISKLKNELLSLNKEEAQLRKLVNIARPTSLPELLAPVSASHSSSSMDTNALKNKLMLAARKKAVEKQKVPASSTGSSSCDLSTNVEGEEEEEEEEEDDNDNKEEGREEKNITKLAKTVKESKEKLDFKERPQVGNQVNRTPALIGPAKPSFIEPSSTSENAVKLVDARKSEKDEESEGRKKTDDLHGGRNGEQEEEDDNDDDDNDNERSSKAAERRRKRNRRRQQFKNEKALEKTKAQYDASDPNYSVWLPPEDQSGDGTTKLNAKLGY